jgi:hypothetical protein
MSSRRLLSNLYSGREYNCEATRLQVSRWRKCWSGQRSHVVRESGWLCSHDQAPYQQETQRRARGKGGRRTSGGQGDNSGIVLLLRFSRRRTEAITAPNRHAWISDLQGFANRIRQGLLCTLLRRTRRCRGHAKRICYDIWSSCLSIRRTFKMKTSLLLMYWCSQSSRSSPILFEQEPKHFASRFHAVFPAIPRTF